MLGAGWGVSSNVPVPTDDFAEFYEASYGRVVALVAAIAGERHQAEDIAQEAFARALTRWSRVARYDLPAGVGAAGGAAPVHRRGTADAAGRAAVFAPFASCE